MTVKFMSLASGSSGNCYYLPENGGEALGEGGFADPGGAVQCDDRQTLHDYSSSRIALISIVFSSAVPTETRRFRGRP